MPLLQKVVAKYPKLPMNLPSKGSLVFTFRRLSSSATYNYGKDTTVKEMIDQMLAAMDQKLKPMAKLT